MDPNSTNPAIRPNKQIDTKLSTPLFNLPRGTIPAPDGPTSLPQRNLLRHVTWQLPSGQSIARAMHVEALFLADLSELTELDQQLHLDQSRRFGLHPQGSGGHGTRPSAGASRRSHCGRSYHRAAALDRHSFLSVKRGWRPTLPTTSGQVTGEFRVIHFLTFAAGPPPVAVSRSWRAVWIE